MLNTLSKSEMEAAAALISGGLTMAQSSMEKILNSPIDLKKIDYGNDWNEIPRLSAREDGMFHLIKTELKGQLTGSCFLILSEGEVNRIYEACIPPEMRLEDKEEDQAMKLAFVKEMDNMVSAAVITEFSNILKLEIYGDVPFDCLLNEEGVNKQLEAESQVHKAILHFKAIFHGKELKISPDFIWMFSDNFIDEIKNFV